MPTASNPKDNKATLSPAKQALLEKRLREISGKDQLFNGIPRRKQQNFLPLSFAQQRLWFLDQLEPGSIAYNIPRALSLIGALDVDVLTKSLYEIVRRHEALRTKFTTVEGYPVQVITPELELTMPILDLSHLSSTERALEARRLIDADAKRPFDLSCGPLLRATLIKLAAEEHIFLLTVHHIVSDGWSIGLFFQELSLSYEAFAVGKPSPLPELPIQYADYAVWQRTRLQGEVLEKQLSYWRQQLAGAPAALELPTDKIRPVFQTLRGAHYSNTFPNGLTEQLKVLAQHEGVTLYMLLLAAFQVVLARYTGKEDIVVGSPIAGRNRTEIEGLIGLFINMLVMRSSISDDPTFREFLARVRKMTLSAYEHQDLPFEKLVEELQPERNLRHAPLVQVIFDLSNITETRTHLLDLRVKNLDIANVTSRFDLILFVGEEAGGLSCWFEYSTDLFDASTISRFSDHFKTLLEGIVVNPERRVSELPMLTEAERQRLLIDWNSHYEDYPRDKTILALFELQAEQTPDVIAVDYEDERLTYKELNRRANQLAHYLQTLSMGPEVLVGICVERSLEMVVGLLGILKAGRAYVPLDPQYPEERLSFMLKDAAVPVLLTQERLLPRLPSTTARIVCLDKDWPQIGVESEENLISQIDPENLAYVIYTSGSTGKPKGVQIPQCAVVNFLTSMRRLTALSDQDRLLAVTTLSFDIAGLELFLPLTVGARLIIAGQEIISDGKALSKKLADTGATVMQATPATWRLLLDGGWNGQKQLKILCGGEALPRELADQLLAKSDSVWNLYGPTETTIWSATHKVEPGRKAVLIGKPIANTQIYILDSHLEPVPVGVPGELYIGGVGLARGYLNRQELTAEYFIPDAFSENPGGRLYRTGDLARYLDDGDIECLGRIDHQIKIRGYRIELGEIESVLREQSDVRECVVVAREDQPGDRRLVAYLVRDNGESFSTGELRDSLKERLPNYMVPSAFVVLDRLPRTPNGKIDRRAFPPPEGNRLEAEDEYQAPRNAVEQVLAEIWIKILGTQPVGIHDNFFEIGGHSLLATRVASRVRETFDVDLPLAYLFDKPTVAGLAEFVENAKKGDRKSIPAINTLPRG